MQRELHTVLTEQPVVLDYTRPTDTREYGEDSVGDVCRDFSSRCSVRSFCTAKTVGPFRCTRDAGILSTGAGVAALGTVDARG